MGEIRRRDMGIAGAIVVLSQALTNFQSSHSISAQIEDLKDQLQRSKLEREQFFVRKTEMVSVISKMDKMSEQLIALKEQVSSLGHKIEQSYSFEECDPLILDCRELVSRD